MLVATLGLILIMAFAYFLEVLRYDPQAREKTVERVQKGVDWWKSLNR